MWLRRVGSDLSSPPMRIRRESIDAYWLEDAHIEVVLKSGWQMAVTGTLEEFDRVMGVKRAKPQIALVSDDDDDFDLVWEEWSKVRAVGKKTAIEAWHKTRKERPQIGVLLGMVKEQLGEWRRENRPNDKIPYLASWLNAHRWADLVRTSNGQTAKTVAEMLAELDAEDMPTLRLAP